MIAFAEFVCYLLSFVTDLSMATYYALIEEDWRGPIMTTLSIRLMLEARSDYSWHGHYACKEFTG